MLSFALTHVGNVRTNNEDSFYTTDNTIGNFDNLYIVADGMGGHNAGEVASMMSIEYIKEYLETNHVDLDTQGTIMDSIFSANQKINFSATAEFGRNGMGTTVTMCTIKDNKAYIGHVGDSRAYILSGNDFKQLTNDHTYVNELVQKGLMTKEQALIDPNRNIITRAVGIDSTVRVDTLEHDVASGDVILICSDGLSGLVENDEIKEILLDENILNEKKCESLVSKALSYGGIDNISVVLIFV